MGVESIPQAVRDKYHIDERGHASANLADFCTIDFRPLKATSSVSGGLIYGRFFF